MLSPKSIEDRWKTELGIEISDHWHASDAISECRDRKTGLVFYHPKSAAGDGGLYTKLQNFSWYYMPWKWEHEQALNDTSPGCRVLEVGCGFGSFLKRLKELGRNVEGIELNEAAVAAARKEGLNVHHALLQEHAASHNECYDVVCHFEVLEHVTDVASFLHDCVTALRPGGRLLFAVPNMSSFLRHDDDALLNLPPHHMSRWRPETIRALQDTFPIVLERLIFEPLASYHIDYFAGIHQARMRKVFPRLTRLCRPGFAVLRWLLQAPWIRSRLTGHTIYASFRKVD